MTVGHLGFPSDVFKASGADLAAPCYPVLTANST
jgi:hypothetical protein